MANFFSNIMETTKQALKSFNPARIFYFLEPQNSFMFYIIFPNLPIDFTGLSTSLKLISAINSVGKLLSSTALTFTARSTSIPGKTREITKVWNREGYFMIPNGSHFTEE